MLNKIYLIFMSCTHVIQYTQPCKLSPAAGLTLYLHIRNDIYFNSISILYGYFTFKTTPKNCKKPREASNLLAHFTQIFHGSASGYTFHVKPQFYCMNKLLTF